MTTSDSAGVLERRTGALARLTLNRPAAFNALDLGMVRIIAAALDRYEADPEVRLVMIDGAGDRAFCAGGDIRVLYEAARVGRYGDLATFFGEEYRLNGRIARFGKPIVSIMDGLCMGGGIGLGAHASHRVVTERSVLAMPETRIGFVPDVGGTFLLARAPGHIGIHLGLTGGRLDAADALFCGLADHQVASERLPALKTALAECRSEDEVTACLAAHAAPAAPSRLAAAQGWIDRCYAGGSVEAILAALGQAPEAEARAAGAEIAANAPTALKVAFKSLREARRLGLEACLARELRVSCSITRMPDFVEGVRAAVVDKDRKPAWRPARLEDVGEGDVLRHFESGEEDRVSVGKGDDAA